MMIYTGVVEDRNDPLKLGRCRVRIVGLHTEDLTDLPMEDLPWAYPMMPITSAAMNGIGHAPVGPVEGTWVVIIFRDINQQQPIMIGTVGGIPIGDTVLSENPESGVAAATEDPGTVTDFISPEPEATPEATPEVAPTQEFSHTDDYRYEGFLDPNKKYPSEEWKMEPDTHRLARHQSIDKTIVVEKEDARSDHVGISIANGGSTWDQPEISYNAKYPFNHIFTSESGHVMEFDDTEDMERVHIYHTAGTYTEIDPNGSQINRVVGNDVRILENDHLVHIVGSGHLMLDGDFTINVSKTAQIQIDGDAQIQAKNVIVSAENDFSISCSSFYVDASDSINLSAGSMISASGGSSASLSSGGTTAVDGTMVAINEGQSVPPLSGPSLTPFSANIKAFNVTTRNNSEDFNLENTEAGVEKVKRTVSKDTKYKTEKTDTTQTPSDKQYDAIKKGIDKGEPPSCSTLPEILNRSIKLSNYFNIGQLCRDNVTMIPDAGHLGLSQREIACNLYHLATYILDPLMLMHPTMKINSAFRTKINGALDTGQHGRGQAVDIGFMDAPPNGPAKVEFMYEKIQRIKSELPFDQLLLEYVDNKKNYGSSWIHISYNPQGNRSTADASKIMTFLNHSRYDYGIVLPIRA